MSTTTTPGPRPTYDGDAPARPIAGPVLLATDGRARTVATAVAARRIAEARDVPVEVLAVVTPIPAYALGYEVPTPPPDFEEVRRATVEGEVRARLAPVFGVSGRWSLDVRYGPPARVITDVARERRAGLVVLGRGSHGAMDRLFGDEVSLQVIRRSSVPVLAVAPDRAGPIRRAVVGVDFSAASIRAARTALALIDHAPDAPGLLTLVHVRSPLEDRFPVPVSWAAEYEATAAAMMARLRDMLRPELRDDLTLETRLRTGDVVDRLLEAADETGADLVAVGTQGPGWIERVVVGSVATSTLRRARRTVLVAPVPDAAERVRSELRIAGQVTLTRVEDWAGALDAFTRRNMLRRARLEVGGPALTGFVVGAQGYRFGGATYDPHDHRIEIMLGDEMEATRHLTHTIRHVRSVEIVAPDGRRDHALLVEDAQGHSVLTFVD